MVWLEITFRENLKRGLTNANDEDLILISDLDEIPNLNNLDTSFIKNKILIFEQRYFTINLIYFMKIFYGKEPEGLAKEFNIASMAQKYKGKNYSKWNWIPFFEKIFKFIFC